MRQSDGKWITEGKKRKKEKKLKKKKLESQLYVDVGGICFIGFAGMWPVKGAPKADPSGEEREQRNCKNYAGHQPVPYWGASC